MQLTELSRQSGTSTASIKFYLREGLLPSGDRVHSTRADYGTRHVERLELIAALRQIVGLGIDSIRRILVLADEATDQPQRTLDLLATIQSAVLGLEDRIEIPSPAGDALLQRQGWPDVPSDARNALNAHLERMKELGIGTPDRVMAAYADAVDSIAGVDLEATGASGTVDQLVRTAAIGMHMHHQLLLRMLALAQASHSIRRYG